MEPISNETWKSFQRSYYRRRLLVMLASLGEAYVGQLARALRLPHGRIMALLHGRPPGYAVELSLVELGLARQKPTVPRGRAYEITAKGRRKARSIAAAKAKKATQPEPAQGGTRWSVTWNSDADDRSSVSWSFGG